MGSTSAASNSTATLCLISSTVRTTRKPFVLRTSTPAKPISEPALMGTFWPTTRLLYGSNFCKCRPERNVSISHQEAELVRFWGR